MKAYYEARAPVYDDWWLGTGPFVVVDSALRDDVEPVEWQERRLRDGSTWQVYLQALLRAGDPRRRARRRRDGLRRALVRRRTIRAVKGIAPFLRVADAEASAAWYARLGFREEWRTRAEPHLPLFLAITNDEGRIFLSEHTGDAHPDTLLYVYVADVDAVAGEFGVAVGLAYYGMREVELTDPDGNRLRVGTPVAG